MTKHASKSSRAATRAKPRIEEVEPRILYSADFSPALLDASGPHETEQRTLDAAGEFAASTATAHGIATEHSAAANEQSRRHEVVFVDTATPDYQKLVDDIKAQSGADRQIDVVLLDAGTDGVKQISATLAGMQDVSAVHLVSHGADGEIQLGGSTLNFDSLLKSATQIKSWGQALTTDADVLIYGCDVAEHADGKALVDALSRLTGADVAASDDVTGAAAKGGDWDLEYQIGRIDTPLVFSYSLQLDWNATLQAAGVGGETRVNSTTSGTQTMNAHGTQSVAMATDGSYVVVWNGEGTGDTSGVFFQRYNASGVAQGGETRVNTSTGNTQSQASVAIDASGNFVIAYTSDGQDGSGLGVYARRYNASGTALDANEFKVNTVTAGDQTNPVVAMNSSGTFVIAWGDSNGQDGSGSGVYAQRYNAAGTAQGTNFRLNQTTSGDQWVDGLAIDSAGNFIATWASDDGGSWGSYARRFAANGTPLSVDVRVNTTTANAQDQSTVAMDPDGNYVVVWHSDLQDGSGSGIYGQRYNASGVAQGSEFRVNTSTAGDQIWPKVVMDTGGNFTVIWASDSTDGSGYGLYKQDYWADGTTAGTETRINTTTTNDQGGNAGGTQGSGMAMNAVGNYVVVWSGNGTGDGSGVFAQRYGYLVVDTTTDNYDSPIASGTVTISQLLANRGADGRISLREAITAANNTANVGGPDVIRFNIAGSGVKTITLSTPLGALPNMTGAVIIDGTTQNGYTSSPLIELNGLNAGSASGLVLAAGSSGSTIRGLTINQFQLSGIRIVGSSNNTIAGNFLGTNSAGTAALGNQVGVYITSSSTNNTVGGTTAADRNIISGNAVDGVQIFGSGTTGNIVRGNYIGLDVTGTVDVGNTNTGVAIFNASTNNTIGGTAAGAGNVISGNGQYGVALSIAGTTGNVIQGNLIGTNAAGTSGIGNTLSGVYVFTAAANNTIGGTTAGAGNVIAYNAAVGVSLASTAGSGNAIQGNAIYSNTSLGIDLNADGVTANDAGDADAGPNALQNMPVLAAAGINGANVQVLGTLNSTASRTFRIELFASGAVDASGYGEGQRYLGFVNVTTDASGNATINTTLAATVSAGEYITATATDNTTSSTSEFSAGVVARSLSISGTLYNDVNADAAVSAGEGLFANATVRLYADTGNGVADASDVLVGTTTTNASGAYTFSNLGAATYWVAVDSKTLGGTYNASFSIANVWADQTYGVSGAAQGAGYLGAAGALYGGKSAGTSDNAAALATSEHLTRVTLAASNATGINSGYSFSVIDNTRGDNTDDDASNARVQQGSLRQFILNSNALSGTQTANFSIGTGAQTISVSGAQFANITDAVVLNATSQEGFASTPLIQLSGGGSISNALVVASGGANSTIRGFVINGFSGDAIDLTAGGNLIAGNYIGTNTAGTAAAATANAQGGILVRTGSNNNTIGGTTAVDRNIIAGNGIGGDAQDNQISLQGGSNTIIGNYIGVAADGTTVITALNDGIDISTGATNNIIGGVNAGEGNLIAGSATSGVRIQNGATGSNIRGNTIWANDFGVRISTATSTGHLIQQNSIYGNTNLGIDLSGGTEASFVTANDSGDGDTGANALQNFPVLTSATISGTTVTVAGSLNSTASRTYRIEFFANSASDGSGYGEGQRYLGFANVTTNGSGNATINAVLTATVSAGEYVSATATDSTTNNTSEFAQNVVATSSPPVNTVPGAQTVAEDTTQAIAGISVSDASNDVASMRLTVGNGILNVTLSGGATIGAGANGSADLTISGTQAAINATVASLTYRGNTNFNGADTLTVLSTDGTALTDSDNVAITVSAVNDAPVNTVPGAQTTNEDTARVFSFGNGNQISIADVDAGASSMQVTLTGTNGTITLNGTSGLSFSAGDGTADGTMTFTGTIANINAALNGLSFSPTANFNGAASLQIVTSDQGNTGSGGAKSDSDTIAITVNAVNDSPVNTVPGVQSTAEDTARVFSSGNGNQISIADLDAGASSVQVTLTGTNGAITLNGTSGLVFSTGDGTADATMTFTGTIANINAALNGLSFAPTTNFNGAASLQIVTNDQGNTGGGALSDTDSVTINVAAANDAPVLTGTNNLTAITEDAVVNGGTLVSALLGGFVTDVDSGAVSGIAVTAVDNTNGTWQYSTNGGSSWTSFGTPAANNARLLAADASTYVRFVPNADWNGTVASGLTFRAWDQTSGTAGSTANTTTNGGTTPFSTATQAASITVNAVNDAPVNTMPAAQATAQNAALTFSVAGGNAISVADVDAGAGSMQVTLTANNGVVSLNGIAGLSFSVGDGSSDATMTFTGSIASINAALNGLSFDPTTAFSGAASLQMITSDQGNTGSGGVQSDTDTVGITVSASTAPTASNDAYSLDEDSTLTTDWWDTDWTRRSVITFTGNNFAGATDLADFPVLVRLNSGNIDYSQTQNAGEDLRFFDSDGSALAYEIETWNESGDSYVWVKVPVVQAGSSDSITMYYGNAAAPAGDNPTAVWTSSYSAVYHADDGGGVIADATSNSFDGAAQNGAASAAGLLGGGRAFDGVNDTVDMGGDRGFLNSVSGATLSAWINSASFAADQLVLSISIDNGVTTTASSRAALELQGDDIRVLGRSADSDASQIVASSSNVLAGKENQWHLIAGVLDYASNTISLYLDGTQVGSGAVSFSQGTTAAGNSTNSHFGSGDDGAAPYFGGTLDELRVAGAARSAAWMHAEYLSMTGGLATIGVAQAAPASQGVLGNDSDPDSVDLTAVLVAGPANAGSFTLNADGTFVYTPTANFAGTDTFTYRVSDGSTFSNIATVTLTVNPINDAPSGTDNTIAIAEDGQHVFSTLDFGFADAADSPANSLLAVRISTLPGAGSLTNNGVAVTAGQFVTVTDINSGKLIFTPVADASGTGYAAFTFQVQDDGGTASGGVDLDASPNTISLDVTAVNDTPVNTVPGAQSTNEDSALVFSTGNGNRISIADVDAAGSAVRVTLTASNGAITLSGLAGLAFTTGDGTSDATMTFTGTLAAINGALDGLSFAPVGDFAGAASLQIVTNDQGFTGSGGAQSDTDTVAITVNPVNDAPVDNVPAAQSVNEDTALVFSSGNGNQISVTDVDAGGNPLQVTLTATNGSITLSGVAGLTFLSGDGTADGSMIFTGTLAQINAALNGLSFAPTSEFSGAASLQIDTDDQGNVGSGGAQSDSATVAIAVNAVNDAPVNAVPAAQSTGEDTALVFSSGNGNLVSIGDVDAGASSVQVTLTGTNGAITLNGTAGLTFSTGDGTADGTMTFTGSVAAINAALDGLSFAPTGNFAGAASLQIVTNDQGFTGSGGAQTDNDTVAITVNAANDAPVNTVPAAQTVNEDTTLVFSSGGGNQIAITDIDAGGSAVRVTLTATNGTITLSGVAGLTFNAGNGVADSVMEFTGTVANINLALNGLAFTPAADFAGAASISILTDDQGNTGAGGAGNDSSTVVINVAAVNDAPINSTPGAQATSEDTALVFSAGNGNLVSVSDIDAATLQVTLTAANGTLSLNGTAGLAFGAGDGTADATMTFTGSAAAINAALNGMSFTPLTNFGGAASLQIVTSDLGATGAGGILTDTDTIGIAVGGVNDAPVNTVPGAQATNEDTALVFSTGIGNAIVVGDSDAASLQVTLTSTNGTLTLAALTGLAFTTGDGTADGTMTFTGTIADINAALDGLTFAPTADFNGAASLQIVTDDQGATGAGGAQTDNDTIAINVAAVNDAPTATGETYTVAEDTPLSPAAVAGVLINDADVDGTPLSAVLVTGPSNGSLTLNADGSFTYTPAADFNGADSFVYRASDGALTSGNTTVNINVTAVNDAPVMGANTLTLMQGGIVVLSAGEIAASDVDNAAAGLQFTVSNVTNGAFELVSAPGVAVTTFTQAQVSGGQVRFVHDGSGTAPGYQVTVSDGALSAGPYVAGVNFGVPVVVTPPVVVPPVTPTPPAATPPEPDPQPEAKKDAPKPPPAPQVVAEVVFSGGRVLQPEVIGMELPGPIRAFHAQATLVKANLNPAPELRPAEMTLLIQGSEPTYMEFGPSTLPNWTAASAFPDEAHGQDRDQIKVIMESVRMGGIALSVGVVWWASRVTGLIGSLLASMPAWRHIDPLPIVGQDKKEEEWEDGAEDFEADADELAVSMVLEGSQSRPSI